MAQNNVEINRKHVGLRIILFIIALALAGTFLSIGIISLTSKKSGEYVFNNSYDNNYKCAAFLSGKNNEIKKKEAEINEVYSSLLKDNYNLLNNNSEETNIYGISYLNNHINEDIKIDKYSYDLLKEAYSYSQKYSNYSIFAKPLYDFWDNLFTKKKFNLNYESSDPINNLHNKELIEILKTNINDKEKINIDFKEDNIVRINISDDYLHILKENELEKSIVSLNILYDAYISDLLYKKFKEKGYNNCYFLTPDTFFVINYDFRYNIINSKAESFGYLNITKDEEEMISQYLLYNILEYSSSSFYLIEKEGVKYNRTKYIDISTGYPVNEIKGSVILNDNKNLSCVELTLINNELLVNNSNYDIIKLFSNSDNELNISKKLENRFIKSSDTYKYNFN